MKSVQFFLHPHTYPACVLCALGLVLTTTRLSGAWLFSPLAEDACKVALNLNFETAGRLVGSALAIGFQSLADRMVDDFVREAQRHD